jgi:prepilin-type N-terminal cleavage/methylation domain-containing protein
MRNESGLTLFELMVVLGIMAILASVAVPGFLGWLPKYRMRSAADDVLSTLQYAKLRAVRENDIVAVTLQPVNDSYQVSLDNGAGAQVKSGRMPAGIDLQSTDFPGDVVRFTRRGFPFVGGNIVVANGTGTRTINLTLGGSASIQLP